MSIKSWRTTAAAVIAVSMALTLAGTATADDQLQEVVVTAQKRAENVQKVPISVDTLSAQELADNRVMSVSDLVNQFAGLSLKASSSVNQGLSIRGVGTQNDHLTAQQAVGQFVDEVAQVTPFTSQLGLFDMAQIEIVKGPQNTLYGRNTTGGAVDYVTRAAKPGEDFNGYMTMDAGNFQTVNIEGAASVPLSQALGLRVAFQSQNQDGVFTNLADGSHIGAVRTYSGRVSFAEQLTDNTLVIVTGYAGFNRSQATPNKGIGLTGPNGTTACPYLSNGTGQFEGLNSCVAANKTGALFNPSTAQWQYVYDGSALNANIDNEGANVRVTRSFENFDLVSLTSFESTSVDYVDDSGGLPYTQFTTYQLGTYDVTTQDMRLQSTGSSALRWMLGGSYSYEDDTLATIVRNNAGATAPPGGAIPAVTLSEHRNIGSIYGQTDWEFVKNWTLTTGLRFTDDRATGRRNVLAISGTSNGLATGTALPSDFNFTTPYLENVVQNVTIPCKAGLVLCNGPATEVTQTLNRFGGKVGVEYQVTDEVMSYASFSRGFKAGAFDVRAQAAFNGTGNTPVGPETINAYEIGMKSTMQDHRLQLNGAIFKYDWYDMQAFATIPGIGPAFLNLPKAGILGEELSAKLAAGAGWRLELSADHLDSKVDDAGNLGAATATDGSVLQNTPAWSFNAAIARSFILPKGTLTPRLAVRYDSSQYGTLNETPSSRISAATFLDGTLNYDFGKADAYTLGLWVNNITAEKTCLSMNALAGFTNTNACIPNNGTQMYGARISVKL